MKQIEVQIMGQGYLLPCPPGGEALLYQAVERVDSAMCKIRDAGKVKARDRIAVLASLNLAFELSDLHQQKANVAPPPDIPTILIEPAAAPTSAEAQVLMDVLRRLDAALGEDGQLL